MAPQDPIAGSRIVTLTTDFGVADAYAGILKAVLLSRAPGAQIVDLTHEVRPQAVLEAAFLFESAWRFFPEDTVHIVVVDPGVGTERRRVAIAAHGQLFVGPDNGCLSAALPSLVRGARKPGADYEAREVALPTDVVAVSIENESLMLTPVSSTFEGRDVFAPAAAHLSRGGLIVELGPRLERMVSFPEFAAPKADAGIDGRIMRVDRFGNLITDIRGIDVPLSTALRINGDSISFVATYAGASGLCALQGSSGYLEIAMPNGSAASVLGVEPGQRVIVDSR